MKPFKPDKEIKDIVDYNEYASQIFEEYLKTFTKENRLIRDVDPDNDNVDDDCLFMYTQKGMKLIDRMMARLIKVGEAHFTDESIEIKTYMYREY